MNLAIFDLDNTILEGDSDHAWGVYVQDLGLISPEDFKAKADMFYAQYVAGELNLQAYLDFVISGLKLKPINEMIRHRNTYIETIVKPMFRARILQIMQDHKNNEDKVLIITATNDFLVAPLKEILPVDDLIATNLEIDGKGFTGRVINTPSFREGKITRLKLWLEQTGYEFEKISFYSDSNNDLPLLNEVDIPIAVTPDEVLRTYAEQNNWQIID